MISLRRIGRTLLAGLLVMGALAGCMEPFGHERRATPTPPAAHQTAAPERSVPPTVAPVPAVPPEVAQSATQWPLANKDYGNTRATKDSQINASNVNQLGLAWTFKLQGASKWGSAAGGPLIANNIVYFQDLQSNIYAFDLATGGVIWQKIYGRSAFGPNGPGIGWGKLFLQDGIDKVIALDLNSGDELWVTDVQGSTGANQPLAYGGYVYTGLADGAYSQNPKRPMQLNKVGTSGYALGLDQSNGTLIWKFQTVEVGFWGHPEINSGAGIWFPPAIDTATGMTFWATGNPSPMPGTTDYPNASSRPGPNLYSETLLAIDGKSGKLAWYYQVRQRDIMNYDLQNPPMLAMAKINGQNRPVVIATGKMGVVYCFDRESGELLWQTPVGKHENDDLQEIPLGQTVDVYPGFWGGIEAPAATADGVVYVATENLPSPYNATAFDAKDGDEAVQNIEGRIDYSVGASEVVALDLATGQVLWSTPLPTIDFGGVTVVNDLLFTATYDGIIYALNRADGSIVWTFQVPGGIVAWPAVAGDTIVWPVGLGREPVVLALRLGASTPSDQPAARPLPGPTLTPFPVGTPGPLASPVLTPTAAVTPTVTSGPTTTLALPASTAAPSVTLTPGPTPTPTPALAPGAAATSPPAAIQVITSVQVVTSSEVVTSSAVMTGQQVPAPSQ